MFEELAETYARVKEMGDFMMNMLRQDAWATQTEAFKKVERARKREMENYHRQLQLIR